MTGALLPPAVDLHRSFLDALREFQAEGRLTELDAAGLADTERFSRYVAGLHAEARPETPRPAHWVPGTTLWYVDAGEFVGTLQIRHWLTDQLREVGGHIGYEVRPSVRRRGHATRMLALARPIAHDLGVDPALLTCDETNVASRKVIEANGGRAATPIPPKLRYWIATS